MNIKITLVVFTLITWTVPCKGDDTMDILEANLTRVPPFSGEWELLRATPLDAELKKQLENAIALSQAGMSDQERKRALERTQTMLSKNTLEEKLRVKIDFLTPKAFNYKEFKGEETQPRIDFFINNSDKVFKVDHVTKNVEILPTNSKVFQMNMKPVRSLGLGSALNFGGIPVFLLEKFINSFDRLEVMAKNPDETQLIKCFGHVNISSDKELLDEIRKVDQNSTVLKDGVLKDQIECHVVFDTKSKQPVEISFIRGGGFNYQITLGELHEMQPGVLVPKKVDVNVTIAGTRKLTESWRMIRLGALSESRNFNWKVEKGFKIFDRSTGSEKIFMSDELFEKIAK